jgi:hypothetical protein
MNAQPSALKLALTLKVHKLRGGHTIPQNEVEHLDVRHRSPPDVLNFLPNCEQIVIDKDRERSSCQAYLNNQQGEMTVKALNSPEI